MDEVLKQRLIGAALIIALAVIFVPMFFDEPSDPRLERTLDPDMPRSPMANQEVRRLPLNPNASRVDSSAGSAEADDTQPNDLPDPVVAEVEVGTVDSMDTTAQEEALIVEEDSGVDRVEPVDETDGPSNPGPEVASTQPVVGNPDSGIDWSSVWRVQVASFGSQQTAQSVVADLEEFGYRAYVDPIVRGKSTLFRIQTGPFPSQASAQTALEEIARTISGVTPVVRGPNQVSTASIESGYAVQVGSFTNEENVQRLEARLEEAGFTVYSFDETIGDRTIWRVRVGTVSSREEADALLEQLRAEVGLEGLVVSEP